MGVWTEFFREGEGAINGVGEGFGNKRMAITAANKRGATHVRFYDSTGRVSFLKKDPNWRGSNEEEFRVDLGEEVFKPLGA